MADFPILQPPCVLNDPELVLEELDSFYAAGGRAIAEMTVHGWGRDVGVLRELSSRSGIQIIATSGFYIRACHPVFVTQFSIDELAAILVRELTYGADGTEIRTGVLKSAISRPTIEGLERKCARAVARAQRHTGASIMTHSAAACRFEVAGGNVGMQLLDLFEAEGVNPGRVIIGHVDSNVDVRQLTALVVRGAFVEFDLVGRTERLLDETRVELLCRLVEMGYDRHLLLSTDVCRVSDLRIRGGRGYDYVLVHFVPRLRKAGFDDELLHRILVENPARALSMESNGQ
jgi:phosphotriesterase-related protein